MEHVAMFNTWAIMFWEEMIENRCKQIFEELIAKSVLKQKKNQAIDSRSAMNI